jgi:hypothetical protein
MLTGTTRMHVAVIRVRDDFGYRVSAHPELKRGVSGISMVFALAKVSLPYWVKCVVITCPDYTEGTTIFILLG